MTRVSIAMHGMQTPAAKRLGRKFEALRRRPGKWVDQGQLARLVGVSQSTMSRIEAGEVPLTVEMLCKIARALGVSASLLLSEVGE